MDDRDDPTPASLSELPPLLNGPQNSTADTSASHSRDVSPNTSIPAHSQIIFSPEQSGPGTLKVIEISDDEDDDAEAGSPSNTTAIPPKRTFVKKEPSPDLCDVDVDPLLNGQIFQDPEDPQIRPPSDLVEPSIEQDDVLIPGETGLSEEYMMALLNDFNKNNEIVPNESDAGIEDEVDSDEDDTRRRAEFAKVKDAFLRREKAGEVDMKDIVEFKQAEKAEYTRCAQRKGRKAYAEEEESMFFPERAISTSPYHDVSSDDDVEIRESSIAAQIASNKRGYAEVSGANDNDEGLPSEEEAPRGQPAKRGRRGRGATGTGGKPSGGKTTSTTATRGKGTRGKARGAGRGSGRGGKKKGEQSLFQVTSLLPYDVFGQASKNREAEPQPTFTTKNRKHALAELIASIPIDQRDIHVGDKKLLENSVKMFTGHGAMRADGAGKWKLRGMVTPLHHYQTIGAGKMRQRENEGKPNGGLLSDEMGLGKTVMAIANIVDGRAALESNHRTTLIITPAALQQQWYNEIKTHVDEKTANIKNILTYKSSAFHDQDHTHLLNNFDIVITSYYEIVKSYPKKNVPPELVTARAKEEWWDKFFAEHKGPLHRVKWHRVVLDEAQAIKNHNSRTSEGVWKLRGKYRWTLSGTPVVNSLEEFFAYFRFLKVIATGDFETWKRNFCKKGSEDALKRLQAMLEKIMIRRTHQDQLFGRPIIQLPPVKPVKTIELEFSSFERALYKIVRDRFVAKIRSWSGDSNTSNNFYILLLRLRQLTAHMLLIQRTLKDLLQIEDLEKLWSLTNTPEFQADSTARAQAAALQAGLETITLADQSACVSKHGQSSISGVTGRASGDEGASSASASADLVVASNSNLTSNASKETEVTPRFAGDISAQFQRCLKAMHDDGQWEKANARSLCPFCGNPPQNPHVTSCLHIYCFGCLNELAYAGLIQGEEAGTCLECSCKFKKAEVYAARAFDDASSGSPTNTVGRQKSTTGGRKGSRDTLEGDVDWYKLTGPVIQSTKTIAAVKQMEEWWEQDEDNKILLFSQFRGVLRVFERICTEKGWGHTQFHGEMSFDARNKAIHKFSTDPGCKVLLAAMKAGGVGLNLTAANRVILIDLWWNVAMETQAYCRVFRIGQTRDVEVVRFAVKNTIDMDILKMQERKTNEINTAMDRKNRIGGLNTEELLRLFGSLDDGDLGETGDGGDKGGSGRGRARDDGMGAIGDVPESAPFIITDDPYLRPDSDVEEPDEGGMDATLE